MKNKDQENTGRKLLRTTRKEERMKIVNSEICEAQVEKLTRSIIVETLSPVDFNQFSDVLIKEDTHIVEVCELGAYKVLITFDSTKAAKEALSKGMNQQLIFLKR